MVVNDEFDDPKIMPVGDNIWDEFTLYRIFHFCWWGSLISRTIPQKDCLLLIAHWDGIHPQSMLLVDDDIHEEPWEFLNSELC